jgi:hypothetical protein
MLKGKIFLNFQYNRMKMQGLNKEPLRKTLLPAYKDKPSMTLRSNYPDPKCKDNKNKDKEFTQEFTNKTVSYHPVCT